MALSALENVFPPVPADVAVALGAFLARRGELSVVLLGSCAGSPTPPRRRRIYFFARAHGRAFFETGWGRGSCRPTCVAALEEAYAR